MKFNHRKHGRDARHPSFSGTEKAMIPTPSQVPVADPIQEINTGCTDLGFLKLDSGVKWFK